MIISESKIFAEHVLVGISRNSAGSTTIIILPKTRPNEIKYLLELAWKNYMMNAAVVQYLQDAIQVSFYQPFLIKNGKKGFVTNFVLKDDYNFMNNVKESFNKRADHMYGSPLRVCFFYTAIQNDDGRSYKPRTDKTFQTLWKAINFTAEFLPTNNCMPDVSAQSSSYKKSSWELMNLGKVDLIIERRPIQIVKWKNVEFLFPITEAKFTFVTAKFYGNYGELLIRTLSVPYLIMCVATYTIIVLVWKLLENISEKLFSYTKNDTWMQFIIKVIGISLLVSQSFNIGRHGRFLLMMILFFSIITTSIFQAKIVGSLTSQKNIYDINTLKDLDESDLSLVTIPALTTLIKTFFKLKIQSGELSASILDRLKEDDKRAITNICRLKNNAFFIDDVHVKEIELLNCGKPLNTKYIHIMPFDLFPKLQVTYSVAKNLPIKNRINWVLMTFKNNGLIHKWRNDLFYDNTLKNLKTMVSFEDEIIFNMKQLQVIFKVWLCCCGFSMLVFGVELLRKHISLM